MFVPMPGRLVGEVGVALRPVQQLADDSSAQRSPTSVEGVGDGAVLVVSLRHASESSALDLLL